MIIEIYWFPLFAWWGEEHMHEEWYMPYEMVMYCICSTRMQSWTRIKKSSVEYQHNTDDFLVCGLHLLISTNDKICPRPQGEDACVCLHVHVVCRVSATRSMWAHGCVSACLALLAVCCRACVTVLRCMCWIKQGRSVQGWLLQHTSKQPSLYTDGRVVYITLSRKIQRDKRTYVEKWQVTL